MKRKNVAEKLNIWCHISELHILHFQAIPITSFGVLVSVKISAIHWNTICVHDDLMHSLHENAGTKLFKFNQFTVLYSTNMSTHTQCMQKSVYTHERRREGKKEIEKKLIIWLIFSEKFHHSSLIKMAWKHGRCNIVSQPETTKSIVKTIFQNMLLAQGVCVCVCLCVSILISCTILTYIS